MANSERGKYAELIDEEVWGFIERSVSCFPADSGEQSMATQRALYNAMSQQFYAGRPAGVTAHDYESHTYQPLIFYKHTFNRKISHFSLKGLVLFVQ